jgi:purine-nucleoside phosphorylase
MQSSDPTSEALAQELGARGLRGRSIAVVLGSGLGAFVEGLANRSVVEAEELEHLPASRVPGHAGRLVLGELAGVELVVQQGRVHLYEGWSALEVTRAVRAFAACGVRAVVLTNAAGSLVEEWGPGTLMRIDDHVNVQGRGAVLPAERGSALPYDAELGELLARSARAEGIELVSGVYAGVLGPAYETPAEIAMLRGFGAHAVGMSTVAEACAARVVGLRVLGLSCLSNHAAGIVTEPLRHEDVVAAGEAASEAMVRLFERALPALAGALA